MTTKYRIILGFVCMMVLLVVTSFLGYRYLDKSISGLVEYRRLARMNVRTSDALAYLNEAAAGMNSFLTTRDTKAIDDAKAALDKVDQTLAEAQQEMQDPNRLATTERIRKGAQEYKQNLTTLAQMLGVVREQYMGNVVPNSEQLGESFKTISETAANVGNSGMLLAIEETWNSYAFMLSAMGRYYYGREDSDLTLVQQRAIATREQLERIGSAIRIDYVRGVYNDQLMPVANSVLGAVDTLIGATANANKAVSAAIANEAAIAQDVAALSEHYNNQMNTYGVAVTAESRSGQKALLGSSAVGVLIGLILATLICLGFLRVLADLAGYAAHIAQGDFDYHTKTKEKGEVGTMLDAMHEIPHIVEKLIAEANAIADRISVGDYRARLPEENFPGGYGEIAKAVSTVSGAFTHTLDQIPLAIITADKDYNMLFINEVTKTVLGSDMTGLNCGKCFKSPVCDTDDCFARRARKGKQAYSGETTIYPDSGINLNIAVTGIPFFDKKGELAGHLEICTDISELQKKQRAIESVATQASEISSRIAAASEQLSAQVEQVSRGAEIQRDRVSSTASAMTEMNSTVIEVARSAGEASEQSENTRMKAQEGEALVHQVVTAINVVNEIGQTLHTNMQELGVQAESIGSVMNMISDIADQTNLLALNAAIEAARAGEAGRGFAVVADEVRKLAEKTMHATQEVGSSISAIQQSAQVNIAEVGKAVASVADADKLAISSGQALTEIVSMASANSAVVASIATASEEQSATSEEISHSTEEINRIVIETAEGMTQSSNAVQELSRMAQELRSVMASLK